MNIKFRQCHSANYKSGRTGKIGYIVIHYTANNGDTANGNADYYAGNSVGASAHYFVDENEVWQSVKDSDTAWAVGGTTKYKHPRCRNANSISVELCSRNRNGSGKSATDSGWYFKNETVERAAELTRELMKKYNIPIENVIRHFDVWAKTCPAPFVNDPQQWADFKRRLEESPMTSEERGKFNGLVEAVGRLAERVTELEGKKEKVYHYFNELPDYARDIIKELYDKGIYKGNGADDLNLPETLMRNIVINYRAELYK